MEALLGRRVRVPPEEWGLADGVFWGVIVQLGTDTSGKACVGVQLDWGDLFHWPTEMVIHWIVGQAAPKRPKMELSGNGLPSGHPAQVHAATNEQDQQGSACNRGSLYRLASNSSHGHYGNAAVSRNEAAAAVERQQSSDGAMAPQAVVGPPVATAAAVPQEPSDTAALVGPPNQSHASGPAPSGGRQQAGVAVANCRLAQIQKLRALERRRRDAGSAAGSRCPGGPPKPMPGVSGRTSAGGPEAPATAATPDSGTASPVPPRASLATGVQLLLETAQNCRAAPSAAAARPAGAGAGEVGSRAVEGPAARPVLSTGATAAAAAGVSSGGPPPRQPQDGRLPGRCSAQPAGPSVISGAAASCAATGAMPAEHPQVAPAAAQGSAPREPAHGPSSRKRSAPEDKEVERGSAAAALRCARHRSIGAHVEEEERRRSGVAQSTTLGQATAATSSAGQHHACGGLEQGMVPRGNPVDRAPGIPTQASQSQAPSAQAKPPLSPIQPQAAVQPAPAAARQLQQPRSKPLRGNALGAGSGAGPAAADAVPFPKNGAAALAAGIPLGCYLF